MISNYDFIHFARFRFAILFLMMSCILGSCKLFPNNNQIESSRDSYLEIGEYIGNNISKTRCNEFKVVSLKGDSVAIGKIVNEAPVLTLFLDEQTCLECQTNAIKQLDSLSDDVDVKSLLILGSYKRLNELAALQVGLSSKIRIFNVNREFMPDNIVKLHAVTFFILYPSLEVSSIFIHRLSDPKATKVFFSAFKNLRLT